ncbi:hypothetical protein BC941DRAFT_422897 [Chlamydoabsidia padenii]|nr:hypothetical protein BC941DRAFT_422897 [Chlamydoabsidia padenii]
MTTLSLSEEIRKQKHKQDSTGWRRHTSGYLYCCFCCWNDQRGFSWKRCCFVILCFLLLVTGVLLFICLPRLPQVTMASTANTVGQDLDWGPPSHPFYRSTWQLNLTLDNRPNFIPLHLLQMDLVLFIHPSTWNSSLPSLDAFNSTTTVTNAPNNNNSDDRMMDIATPFAWSTLPGMTLNTTPQTVNAIFHIDYVAPTSNMTDSTFAQLYQACGPHLITDPPPLNVSLQITFHLLHYLWLPAITVYPIDDDGLICPVN